MTETSCLYLCAHASRQRHEQVVAELVTPLVQQIRGRPELSSLFFVRMSEPTWQVRLRVVGDPVWVTGPYRELAERHLEPHRASGLVTEVEWTRYQREVERYGGEEGMALAEEIYLHDSLACLDLMELERRGDLARNRRELALIIGERFAGYLRLDRRRRSHFHHFGYKWTREMGTWDEEDFARLEGRFQQLRPQLVELLRGEIGRDPLLLWGGEEAARVAEGFLGAVRPALERVSEGCTAGRIHQEIAYLCWSYTHLLSNRLGIYPAGEAVLRYLMHRFVEEEGDGGAADAATG